MLKLKVSVKYRDIPQEERERHIIKCLKMKTIGTQKYI